MKCIDLDLEFCKRIGDISELLQQGRYGDYTRSNSKLAGQILDEQNEGVVSITSAGFLDHDDFLDDPDANTGLLKRGQTILLIPEEQLTEEGARLVAHRQIKRWTDLDLGHQKDVYRKRHPIYITYGDVQVFTLGKSVDQVVKEILLKIDK